MKVKKFVLNFTEKLVELSFLQFRNFLDFEFATFLRKVLTQYLFLNLAI